MAEENKIILYQDDNEVVRVSVRFADEDLWLTQSQLSEIYQTSKSNVSEHIKHIFEDGELDKNVVSIYLKMESLIKMWLFGISE